MRKLSLVAAFFLAAIQTTAQSSFDEKLTSVSNVRMTLNNVGTFGNGFRGSFDLLGFPSAEYPANSGIEHLFEAGLWVGAKVDGSLVAVSTAAFDQSSGYSAGKAGYEFTAEAGSNITERSTLFDNPNFASNAISHQDLVADFSDKNILVPGTQIQIASHDNPMNLDVHFEAYNWNYAFSDFMIICNYTLTNSGSNNLNDLYLSMWANEVVRNTNITPAGQGGSGFYDKGGNGFIDSLNLAYCYDAAGDLGFTESYVGHMFLGANDNDGFHHPSIDSGFKANYQCWQFNAVGEPVFFFPSSDLQRYEKMRDGFNQWPCWTELGSTDPRCASFQTSTIQETINQNGNRSDLVSVGPFENLAPGASISFAWAWVFAKKNEDGKPNSENNLTQKKNLIDHAKWAQTAYNGEDVNFNGILDAGEDKNGDGEITRFILPSPPSIPTLKIVAKDKAIDLYWTENSEKSLDPISQQQDFEGYRIYMTSLGFDVTKSADLTDDLKEIASFDLEGNGLFFETGFAAVRLETPQNFDNDTNDYVYKYTINGLINGWQYAVALTAFDRGDAQNNLESLESSKLSNAWRVFPGKEGNEKLSEFKGVDKVKSTFNAALRDSLDKQKPYVYPNPYYAGASWEGTSRFEEDRKLVFANLPKQCVIRIFTISGDLVKTIEHSEDYNGADARWFSTYAEPDKSVFSGGEHAWNMLSENAQIIARGTYIFSVQDLESGTYWKEKFVVIK